MSKIEANYGTLLTVKSYHKQTNCAPDMSGSHYDYPFVWAVCDRPYSISRVECSTTLVSIDEGHRLPPQNPNLGYPECGSWFSGWGTPFVRNTMFFVALYSQACITELSTTMVSQFIVMKGVMKK